MNPIDLGFNPTRFPVYRPRQFETATTIAETKKRFSVFCGPPGSGKSLCYATVGRLVRWKDPVSRAVYVTGLKGLQQQLNRETGMRIQMGMGNYQCVIAGAGVNCDHGLCRVGVKCEKLEGGCLYFDSARESRVASEVSTNYAYWMNINRAGQGMGGGIGFLALDEAHDAPKHLSSFLRVELVDEDIRKFCPAQFKNRPDPEKDFPAGVWNAWADRCLGESEQDHIKLSKIAESMGAMIPSHLRSDIRKLRELRAGLEEVANIGEDWAWERGFRGAAFEPIYPARYSERLFCGIPKICLASATITKGVAAKLGIKEQDMEYIELPSDFPPNRRPVIYLPIKLGGKTVRVSHNWSELDKKMWLNQIDAIIESRFLEKGIIHTTSYERAKLVLANSRYRELMMTHTSGGTQIAVDQFKKADAPCILVTPTVIEGYDFPGDECRWQIIGKLPFPDLRGRIQKKRSESEKGAGIVAMAQSVVQMAGRPMRSKDDYGETFIIDGQWEWARNTARDYLPKYFRDACREQYVPGPCPNYK